MPPSYFDSFGRDPKLIQFAKPCNSTLRLWNCTGLLVCNGSHNCDTVCKHVLNISIRCSGHSCLRTGTECQGSGKRQVIM